MNGRGADRDSERCDIHEALGSKGSAIETDETIQRWVSTVRQKSEEVRGDGAAVVTAERPSF